MWLIILLLLSVIFIIVATTRLKLHPFLALLLAAFGYGAFCWKMSLAEVVASVNSPIIMGSPLIAMFSNPPKSQNSNEI